MFMSFSLFRRAAFSILGAVAVACFSPLQLSASSVVVTPTGTTPCKNLTRFSTISAAVASVPSNSTIFICPGTYAEQVTITKPLTLTGEPTNGLAGASAAGANNPVIVSPATGVVVNAYDLVGSFPTAAQIAVLAPAGTVSISNLTVDGSNNGITGTCGIDLVGIYYQNVSGTINHVVTRNQELSPDLFGCQDGLAIYVQSGYGSGGTATVTIENSSVHDYDKNGITADGSGTVATINANYVVGIGATPLIGQNGIQVSYGANAKITGNTVTDDVYVNPPDCSPCYSATGILLYDSGGSYGTHLTITGNTVSNTQGAIVAITDGVLTADYNDISTNKVTTSPTAGIYFLDGIDLCSNYNTAKSNTVFNSSGSGIHIDGECTEPGGSAPNSGYVNALTTNTVNEACAGVLTGPGLVGTGNTVTGTITYNVVQVTQAGDSCPAGEPGSKKPHVRLKPHPWHPRSN
jgi:hypothetical protein